MKRPTLSELAIHHNRFMLAIVIGLILFGAYSYYQLPKQEDPKIEIREAVVTTQYLGMSAEKVELLITKTVEEAIREMPNMAEIRSVSLSGTSIIHAELRQNLESNKFEQQWDELRDKINAVRSALPEGTSPYRVNDDFGNVAVLTVALIADPAFDMGQRQDMAQHIADMMFKVEGTKKIDILGVQQERIFIETENAKLAQLGVSPNQLIEAIRSQNIIRPGGEIDANGKNFIVQPSGNYESLEDIKNTFVTLPNQQETILLRDIATVSRGVVDPPFKTAYYNGKPAIIFAIAKHDNIDVLKFTPKMEAMIAKINQEVPAGYVLENMTRQADVVEDAVFGVSFSVLQTVVVVSIVVIMFLGLRTGLIVGSIVPAAILITLSVMNFVGIPLERMSLATLIIALGLLVDDGIIMAEDFKKRIEDGETRSEAIRNTSGTLAIPSLTSSLTTILVFLPLMLAQSDAGEYTRSISLVVLIALLTSWALSLTFTTYCCYRFVKKEDKCQKNRLRQNINSFFDSLNPMYERALRTIMRARTAFVVVMILLFLVGGWAMNLVPKKFFPDSDRAQVLVYLDMPAGTSMRKTDATIQDILQKIGDEERFPHIKKYAAYGGFGGPRFVLSLTPIDPEPSKAFFMIDVGSRELAEPTITGLRDMFAQEFPGVMGRVTKMFLGPSDSSLIEVQVKGPDKDYIYGIAQQLENLLRDINGTYDIKNDWGSRVTEIKVEVNQQNARRAGISSNDVALALETYFSGRSVSEFREGDDIFPIVFRAAANERNDLGRLESVSVYSSKSGANIPLIQVADIRYETQFARVARENLFRTVTVEAKNHIMSAQSMVPLLQANLKKIEDTLPPGYEIEYAGVVGDSAESQASILANLPLCIAIMALIIIAQFRSYRSTVIVFLTVPLIIIGAALGLLIMQANFGFMVILGLYALAGIIINNAVILIDRINIERNEIKESNDGSTLSTDDRNDKNYEAVISASLRRLRPILMSTCTTIIGLMPLILSKDVLFYGQASTIAFGLAMGTVLTLGFVPVMYTFFFGIKPTEKNAKHY